MSFSKKLKNELCSKKTPPCCRKSELYGMLLFARSFSRDKISLLTDNECVAQNFSFLLKKNFGVITKNSISTMYKAEITDKTDIQKIFDDLNITQDNLINEDIIKKDCCVISFIRGAFLSGGNITDPEKEYRAEFRIRNTEIACFLYRLLYELNLEPKLTRRNDSDVVYLKKSENIEDLVTVLGASSMTLKLIDVKILKGVRNNINRKNNLEDANTSKTIDASIRQRNAVKLLIEKDKFNILPPELQEVALLRNANPEATLGELCKLSSVSLTRSGLNHRLNRIIEIAEKYKE